MSDKIVIKEVSLLDVYNELQDVKENQQLLTEKIDEYNGLRERMDKFDQRCKFNLYDEDGVYNKLSAKVVEAEEILSSMTYISKGKSILSNNIITTGLFIIAIIGGLSGLIQLLRLLITAI